MAFYRRFLGAWSSLQEEFEEEPECTAKTSIAANAIEIYTQSIDKLKTKKIRTAQDNKTLRHLGSRRNYFKKLLKKEKDVN